MAFFKYSGSNIYFTVKGKGEPVIFIHGNTASSAMLKSAARMFSRRFRVVALDLPGHGRSDRLQEFPADFWYENAKAVTALIEYIGHPKASLVGTSGGALVALNAGLQRPDLIDRIVADSFEGEQSAAFYAETIREEREKGKKNPFLRIFWRSAHGRNWEGVVDNDSEMIFRHHKEIGRFFHQDLSELKCPVLLTGSLRDEFIPNIQNIYIPLSEKIKKTRVILFPRGKHPAMLSNAKAFYEIAARFLRDEM